MGTISLKNISKSFGSTQVLNNLNVDINDGEFLTLVGPSGCGKSTLLRIIAGLEQQTSGDVLIDNKNVNRVRASERDLAMVFQSYALYPHLTVRRNLETPLRLRDYNAFERLPLIGNFPPSLFVETFDMLKKENFPITVHAGEWDGPVNIRNAINLLHPTRLGHGVRSIEDPDLVKEIIDKDIILETCPTSNIATKIYKDYVDHPVKTLFDQGVKVTVNSDDPPFFNATINGEYKVMEDLGLNEKELTSLTHNAVKYSFCDEENKTKLLAKLN